MIDLFKNRDWGPMLLKEIDEPFDSKDYIYEMKFDGIRSIMFASPKKVTLMSRNKKDITHLFPELQHVKEIVKKEVIFDGEIIATTSGFPDFSKIQNRMHLKDNHKIASSQKDNPVTFIAFDILYENKNLVDLDLMHRKKLLNKYPDNEVFIKSKVFEESGIKLFKEIKKKKLEGIVAKLKKGLYHIDKRTSDFIKIKNIQREKFKVVGFKDNPKSNTASLFLGEQNGSNLRFVGKVLVSKEQEIYKMITKLKKSKSPFKEDIGEDAKFVSRHISIFIEYLEKTKEGHLRHAKYRGIV